MARKKKVVLYGSRGCGYCKAAKDFLEREKVPYDYRDADDRKNLEEMLRRNGGKAAVPTILVNDEAIIGFDPTKIKKALGV